MALSLGRARGATLIGRPLDLTVPVRLESGEDPSTLCFDADVFHADTRIDGGKVRTVVEPGASPQDVLVRIRSSAIVDEPVVTVYLRAGCTQKTTRRYVLLADLSSDAPASAAPVVIAPPVTVPMPQPSLAASAVPSVPAANPVARAPVGEEAVPKAAAKARRKARAAASTNTAAAASPAPQGPAAAPPKRPREAAGGKPRLKLEGADLLVERDPTLRSSTEMLSAPAANEQQRAEAAALWRALNAQPQDLLRDAQRLQGLETDVKSLRDLTVKNQASLGELRTKLQKAEDERYSNGLVYGLIALLLAAIAAAGYAWRQKRSGETVGQNWWHGRDRVEAPDDELNLAAHLPEAAHSGFSRPLTEVDVDLGVDESMFESLKSRTIAPAAGPVSVLPSVIGSDFVSSTGGSGRAVKAEELFDIQQQADFFVSLGQYDQAIEVLKNHISDNVETSALAYLDLFKIYHSLERRAEYDHLREDFNRVFNAQVPPFEAFSADSRGLEAYEAALSRIEALWPSARVLDVIEESIFRKPGSGDGDAFDLEAYRELLLLYTIAKDVVDRRGEPVDSDLSDSLNSNPPGNGALPGRPTFSATAIQPLSTAPPAERSAADTWPGLVPLPKPSPRLGLDIDLSEELSEELPPSAFIEPGEDFSTTTSAPSHGSELRTTQPTPTVPDDNLIDFDLFDSSTEEEIAPKPRKR
ncbi:type IV pilus assembly protein FimV [Variovorax terrae]|uniref:Uncharacterized protein n=1 Tax=Variovorax terrae TaxID=2923278 RepID=A0A9X1VZN5_9BURK|nr:hypothetical protein [Variovorax terrae]MCJ0763403.1 hypothetical protein [Variovorax terrae]